LLSAERAESKKQSAFGKHHSGNNPHALAGIYVGILAEFLGLERFF
jgi:hypothetical protein